MEINYLIILGSLILSFSIFYRKKTYCVQSKKYWFIHKITINTSIGWVWNVIAGSKPMEILGSPVQKVESIRQDGMGKDKVGSIRIVYIQWGKKEGYFKEERISNQMKHCAGYKIFEENIDLFNKKKSIPDPSKT